MGSGEEGRNHPFSVIASSDNQLDLLKPCPEKTLQCWREGSRLWGDAWSIVFQNDVGTVIFLSPLFSYFFNRHIVAEVI